MKRLLKYLTISLLSFANSFSGYSQTKVTGHVFAEVIETTSVSSVIPHSVYLNSIQACNALELGEIVLGGGALSTLSLLASSHSLIGENGAQVGFLTDINRGENNVTLNNDGVQNLKINGMVGANVLNMSEKFYSGKFAIVFAYN